MKRLFILLFCLVNIANAGTFDYLNLRGSTLDTVVSFPEESSGRIGFTIYDIENRIYHHIESKSYASNLNVKRSIDLSEYIKSGKMQIYYIWAYLYTDKMFYTNTCESFDFQGENETSDWMLSLQRDSGAFIMANGSDTINPYFANIGLYYFLEQKPEHADKIKEYLEWYMSKINKDGTIYDYKIVNNKEISKNDYDSSDSYAATFLSLLKMYYLQTKDKQFLIDNISDIKMIAGAIDSTLQSNGLTYAKPDYKIMYLMDNVEVYRGYRDYAYILYVLNDSSYNLYKKRYRNTAIAINRNMYKNNEYIPAIGNIMDWSKFYPDAVANLYPYIYGLSDDKSLYTQFITHHSNWINGKADDFPWVVGYIAVLKSGEKNAYMDNIEKKYIPRRNWPWNILEEGWYIKAKSLE